MIYALAGGKGNRPESLLEMLDESKKSEKRKIHSFATSDAFERARARLVKRAEQCQR